MPDNIEMVTIDQFVNSGTPAQRLLNNGMNLSSLRTNATLRYDEWKELDTAVINAFELRLNGIADLRSRGLTKTLGGMGVLVSMYNRLSQMSAAEMSMWASTDAEQGRVLADLVSIPVPVFFKEFQLDIRFIDSWRRGGGSIDTEQATAAGRVVAEKMEEVLFNGNTTVYGGMPIYGYRTHPSRNTTSGSDWGTATNIYANITTMINGLIADGAPGPFVLYLHTDQYVQTLAISDTTRALNEMQVALANIPGLESIKFSDKMTAGEAVMVSMDPMTVDLAVAEDLMPVEWESQGGLTTHYRAMTVAVPRVKADYEGRSGIFHMTGI